MTGEEMDRAIGERVLVLVPHPDDEIIGCGGTLVRLAKRGVCINLAYLTNGDKTRALREADNETRKTVRLKEAAAVAEAIEVSQAFLQGCTDEPLDVSDKNIERLVDIINRVRPTSMFLPVFTDEHPDHKATNELLMRAMGALQMNPEDVYVFGHEVWSVMPANCYSPIHDEFDRKAELLCMFRTSMKAVDYVTWCEALNAFHADEGFQRQGFVEAFLGLKADAYLDLYSRSEGAA